MNLLKTYMEDESIDDSMNTLEILERTIDLEFERTHMILEFMESELLEGVIMEETVEKKGFFKTVIEKIRNIIETVATKISEFFASITVKNKLEKTEEVIKENPELAKAKVEIKDYSELDRLNSTTLREISNMDDSLAIRQRMIKYRKQRNSILAKGAVVVIGLGTALALVTKNKNEKIKKLKEEKDIAESSLKKMESRYEKMKQKGQDRINELKTQNKKIQDELEIASAKTPKKQASVKMAHFKRDVSDNIGKQRDIMIDMKEKASAQVEILQNASKDTISSISDTVKICANPNKSIVNKISTVVATPAKAVDAVKNGAKDAKVTRKQVLRNEIRELEEKMNRAKFILNSNKPEVTEEHKRKAQGFIRKYSKELHDKKIAYRAL